LNQYHQDISDLLEKYFAGQCSAEERERVRIWMADPANEQELDQFMKGKWDQLPDGGVNAFFEQTRERYAAIRQRIGVKRVVPVAWYYAAASVVALLSFGAVYLYRMELLDLVDPVKMITYETGPGQQLSVRLPDGSKVWLNASTTLNAPDEFRGPTRDLHLNGEAFFEVQHDERKPFYVHTPGFYTRVLGTSFDVKAYTDDGQGIWVTVATGKVAVGEEDSLRGKQELAKLVPNHRGRYDHITKIFYHDTIAAAQITAWREGKLIFRQASLKEMVSTLERWYGIAIDVETSSTLECSFTADYYAGIGLRDILEALRITGKIDYEIGDKKVVIRTRDGCK
jgi:ferric-dicitrate binding protein FerR (iron transport regulator)